MRRRARRLWWTPGDEVERILEILRERQLNVRAIVSTHTHIDHVGRLVRLHAVPRLLARNAVHC